MSVAIRTVFRGRIHCSLRADFARQVRAQLSIPKMALKFLLTLEWGQLKLEMVQIEKLILHARTNVHAAKKPVSAD
jgi:hypothetical protein